VNKRLRPHLALFELTAARDDTPTFNRLLKRIQEVAVRLATYGEEDEVDDSLRSLNALMVRGLVSSEELYPAVARDPVFAAWAELMAAGSWRSCDVAGADAYFRFGRIDGNHDELSYLAFGALSYVNTLSTFEAALDEEGTGVVATLLNAIIAPFFGEQVRVITPDVSSTVVFSNEREQFAKETDWSKVLPRSIVLFRRERGHEDDGLFSDRMTRRIERIRRLHTFAS